MSTDGRLLFHRNRIVFKIWYKMSGKNYETLNLSCKSESDAVEY